MKSLLGIAMLAVLFTACGSKPASYKGALAFEDDFSGSAVDWTKWESQNGASGHILSSRWASNNRVEGGILYQDIRKEKKAGKEWTSASLWTKFSQRFGYFECRYRYGGVSGLNNAFWVTVRDPAVSNAYTYVIDINEGRHKNEVNVHLHRGKGASNDIMRQFTMPDIDFSADFHVFGMGWNEKGLAFFLDDTLLFQIKNAEGASDLKGPAVVRLSTAVMPAAGEVTDVLHGRSMAVDWVKVWTLP